MDAAHVIRLRGPWKSQPPADGRGQVQFTRHFNRPTGLDGGERVWLVIESLPGLVSVRLNGVVVGTSPPCPARLEITELLQPRSELVIEVASELAGDAPAGVRLEIESAG